jgi:hypothetical protein
MAHRSPAGGPAGTIEGLNVDDADSVPSTGGMWIRVSNANYNNAIYSMNDDGGRAAPLLAGALFGRAHAARATK